MQLQATLLPLIVASLAWASPIEKRTPASSVKGCDVSHYQAGASLATAKANGASFVIIKATEGTTYVDSSFSDFYGQANNAGLIRGGYHFAHPAVGGGAAQANYFLAHGGGWTGDGKTLPGMLDLESEGSSGECWGLSQAQMITFIKDFGNTYKAKTGRLPMLYANANWLSTCLKGSTELADAGYPLVIAAYNSGANPSSTPGWPYATFWQWADSGTFPGDQDVFQGSAANLVKFATG